MSRTGGQSDWQGPRLPVAPKPIGPEDLGDPAKGEKVARCLTCGVPLQLVTGSFVPDKGERFAGRRFRYRLCVRCIEHANQPLPPDPLYVDEEIA